MRRISTFSSHSLKPLFPHVLRPHGSLTPASLLAYQSSLDSVINLSVKISRSLPVVSSTASVFAKTLQQLPPSCRLGQRLIKLSWSVIRHPEREKEGGVSVCAGSQLRTGSFGPCWYRRRGGVRIFGPPKPENDKWHLKETVKHIYCIKSSVKVNYKIYGGLIEWVSGE